MQKFNQWFILLVVVMFVVTSCKSTDGPRTVKSSQYKRERPVYSVSDNKQTRKRTAMRNQLGLAIERLRSGELDEAERYVRAAMRADSSSADVFTVMAMVDDARGRSQRAGDNYKRAVDLSAEKGAALNNYGAWLCGNGFAAESLLWFDRALADKGYSSPESALANAGGCALKSGQLDRGERDLRRALEIDPMHAYALEKMMESEYSQQHFFEARAFAQRRLAAAPATASVLEMAVRIEQAMGDNVSALRYQQQLLKNFPEQAVVNPNTGGDSL